MGKYVSSELAKKASVIAIVVINFISSAAWADNHKKVYSSAASNTKLVQADVDRGIIDGLESSFGVSHTDRERRSKTIELLGGGDSAVTPSIFGGGTGVIGYYLTRDLVVDVGLRLALGIKPFNLSQVFDGQVAYEGTGALRYFLGKSLYASFGGGIGLYEATHSESKSLDFSSWKESALIWRPYVGIGNQWHWKTWTILVEWVDIGYYVGLGDVKNSLPNGPTGERPITSEASTIGKVPGSVYVGSKLLMGFAF